MIQRKNRYLILFLFVSFHLLSQNRIQGSLKDLKTKEGVPFAAIAVKGSYKGCISNEEGVFQLFVPKEADSLIVSCIGYKNKSIALSDLLKNPVIYIEESALRLQEVVVYDREDEYYELIDQCRKKLIGTDLKTSKTYFVLESSIGEQAVELLECYYNGSFNASSVHSLDFKNGRVGLAPVNGRVFVNSDISKAFMFINLIGGNSQLPYNPLEFNKNKLKKNYKLKLISISETENDLYHLEFTPTSNSGVFFSGEIWIEKKSALLKRISLNISHTKKHPFTPLFKGEDYVEDVSMQINKTYNGSDENSALDHIDFNYQLKYHHAHNASVLNANPDTSYVVSSKGLMYFYDVGKPFVLPFFKYNEDLSDYRKIVGLSYNEDFWNTNTNVEFSQKMKKDLLFFKRQGILLNFKNGRNTSNNSFLRNNGFFENNYLIWSAAKRISLKKDKIQQDSNAMNSGANQILRSSLYQIKAQLFLDINPVADSIQHYSVSIYDTYESYYNLPEEPVTNCFMNIYFDLFEIERRKMESLITKNKSGVKEMESIYKNSVKNLETQTAEYLSEVQRGQKIIALKKWNTYVKENLGIDNMDLFQIH